MKKGDVLYVNYLNSLVEVIDTRPNAIKILISVLDDIKFEVWVLKHKYKKYTKIGEI